MRHVFVLGSVPGFICVCTFSLVKVVFFPAFEILVPVTSVHVRISCKEQVHGSGYLSRCCCLTQPTASYE